MADTFKERASEKIDALRDRLIRISTAIHDEPELGHQEYKASELLAAELEKFGFQVERGVSGLPTAFKAVLKGKGEGPTVAILAEYDALPEIGHACGHNIIASSALGAGIGLSKVMGELNGEVVVFGTPAEEGYAENAGGKVVMIDEIGEADVAVMVHPGARYGVGSTSLARESFMISFKGKASHAGFSPERGINALEGVLLTFQGINALRQHVSRDTRIHGIIKDGGAAPNIVPETASAHFYVRAPTVELLEEKLERVKICARGAAEATGAKVSFRKVAKTYANKVPNLALAEAFKKNLEKLGAVVPETASAHFYVRAPTVELLEETLERVKSCTRGAAEATGAKVSFRKVANTYANKVPNMALSEAFKKNLEKLGAVFPEALSERPGASTDFGNVSQVIPAASASIFIGDDVVLHSFEATEATASELAHEAAIIGAKSLAHTAIDVLTDPDLLLRIKEEFAGI